MAKRQDAELVLQDLRTGGAVHDQLQRQAHLLGVLRPKAKAELLHRPRVPLRVELEEARADSQPPSEVLGIRVALLLHPQRDLPGRLPVLPSAARPPREVPQGPHGHASPACPVSDSEPLPQPRDGAVVALLHQVALLLCLRCGAAPAEPRRVHRRPHLALHHRPPEPRLGPHGGLLRHPLAEKPPRPLERLDLWPAAFHGLHDQPRDLGQRPVPGLLELPGPLVAFGGHSLLQAVQHDLFERLDVLPHEAVLDVSQRKLGDGRAEQERGF
mmetsp:Transcript_2010/g.4747  ORF Transcript_2010/g.4747 Transcript_2010/m.4747 type:complete len:271 (+) Transcript_2010:3877-4689(+)